MAKPLPSASALRRLVEYHPDGRLRWLPKGDPSWDAQYAGKLVAENLNGRGYRKIWCDGRPFFQHRVIWKMHHGTEPPCIDHINGDRSDNRIENLRPATHGENARACRKGARGSGYKGVIKSSRTAAYEARITYCGKQRHLGTFPTAELAAKAYDAAALDLHGDYAITNASMGLLPLSSH